MKTHMLLKKMLAWRIVFFALLLMFTAVATPVAGFFGSQNAYAITDQQKQDCYDKFSGKDIVFSRLLLADQQLLNECRSSGDCKDAGEGSVIDSRRITCTNPALELAARQAADAEVKPLQTLVCGTIPAGEAAQSVYLQCSDNVRKIYESCDNTGGGVTGSGQDTNENTSTCVRNKLPNPKPTIQQVRVAVAQGRNDAQGIVDEAIKKQEQDKKKTDCEAAGGTWANSKCTPAEEDTTTCAVEGIGWIVCPVMTFMTKLNDAAFGFLNGFLEVPARIFNDPATKLAWEAFRNFGNVAFVIAFLIIIYSQLTGVGVSNYGIKKLLPKLIIAAVLVNVSFYICGILVDLSNIVGGSLYDLLKNFKVGEAQDASTLSTIWTTAGAAILAVGAVVGLIALIIFAPMSLLAFAVVILILVARQAFVVLLIVISPLAFVAYLLPNTESWFKRWWKAFSAVLMIYPIVALIFGASTLAANILMSVGQTGEDTGASGTMMQILAAGIIAIPLFAVPPVIKGALMAAGTVGAKISSYQDRANKGTARSVKEGRIGEAKTAFNARRQVRGLNRRRGGGFIQSNKDAGGVKGAIAGTIAKTGFGTYQKRFDESRAGQVFGGNRGAAAATAGIFHEYDEEVKRQKTLTSGRTNEELLADMESGKGSEEYQAAIAGTVMSRDHRKSQVKAMKIVRDKMADATARGDTKEQARLSSVIKQMAHDNKDKPFGAGDSTLARMEEGTYGQKLDPATGKMVADTTGPDIYQESQQRIETKLSEEKVAHMNPDDTRIVYELAKGNHLTQAQKDNLKEKIEAARVGRYKGDIKPESTAMHNEILDYINTNDLTVFDTTNKHKSDGTLPAGYRPAP